MKHVWILMMVSLVAAAADHDHSHQGAGAKLQLNQGKKWETTEELRAGMEKIRVVVDKAIPEIHSHKMKAEGFRALAKQTSAGVSEIIKTCKLTPEVDAMIHLVLERLLRGAGQIEKGKTFDARHEGAMELVAALQQYSRYFQHPGWKGVSH